MKTLATTATKINPTKQAAASGTFRTPGAPPLVRAPFIRELAKLAGNILDAAEHAGDLELARLGLVLEALVPATVFPDGAIGDWMPRAEWREQLNLVQHAQQLATVGVPPWMARDLAAVEELHADLLDSAAGV